MEAVWANLVDPLKDAGVAAGTSGSSGAGDLEREVGKYLLAQANATFEVTLKDGKLVLIVPGQPPYTLERLEGRRYKFAEPAPTGFFVTFRAAAGNSAETEMYLEQPHGNITLARVKADAVAAAAPATLSSAGPHKELIGTYEREQGGLSLEVADRNGTLMLLGPGQPPLPLIEKAKDTLSSPGLPDTISFQVTRDGSGKVAGITIKQPGAELALNRTAAFVAPLSVEQLMAKVIEAAGGEASLRRHKTMVMTVEIDFENQGMTATGTSMAAAPNKTASRSTLIALGKQVGTMNSYFDGTSGTEEVSFAPPTPLTGNSLEAAKINSDFYSLLNWKTHFKDVTIKKVAKVGDEEVFVVVKTPEKGSPVTDYISTKSFLLLRQDTLFTSDTNEMSFPITTTFSDYRSVSGRMIPFRVVASSPATLGGIITVVKDVKFDVPVPESAFRSQTVAK